MRKALFLVCCFCCFLAGIGPARAAAPNWAVIGGTQYNHIVFGDIYLGGTKVNAAGSILAAFGPGGENDCRGVADVPYNENLSYYLTVVGDTIGENITFRLYESGSDCVYAADENLIFQPDATNDSYDLHFAAGCNQCDIDNDGTTGLKEVVYALQTTTNLPPPSSYTGRCDINDDGKTGLEEAIYALQVAAGTGQNETTRSN